MGIIVLAPRMLWGAECQQDARVAELYKLSSLLQLREIKVWEDGNGCGGAGLGFSQESRAGDCGLRRGAEQPERMMVLSLLLKNSAGNAHCSSNPLPGCSV